MSFAISLRMVSIAVVVVVVFAFAAHADPDNPAPLFSKPAKQKPWKSSTGGSYGSSAPAAKPVQQQHQQYQQYQQMPEFHRLHGLSTDQGSQQQVSQQQGYSAQTLPALPAPPAPLAIQAPPTHRGSLAIQPYQASSASQTPQSAPQYHAPQAIQPYQGPKAPRPGEAPLAPQAYPPPVPVISGADSLLAYGKPSSKSKPMDKMKSLISSVGKLKGANKKGVKSIEGPPQQPGYNGPHNQLGPYNPPQQQQQVHYDPHNQLGFYNPPQQQQQGYYDPRQQQLAHYNYPQQQQQQQQQEPQVEPSTLQEVKIAYRTLYNWSKVLSRKDVLKHLSAWMRFQGPENIRVDDDEIHPKLLLQYNYPSKERCEDFKYITDMKLWHDKIVNNLVNDKMRALSGYMKEVFNEQVKLCNFAQLALNEFGKFKSGDRKRWEQLETWMEVASNLAKSTTDYRSYNPGYSANHNMLNEAITELTQSYEGDRYEYAYRMINTLRDYCKQVDVYEPLLDMTEMDIQWNKNRDIKRLHKLMALCKQTKDGNYEQALTPLMHSAADNAMWNQYAEARQSWVM